MTTPPTPAAPETTSWTPEARIAFLESLAETGEVRQAAAAAGLSHTAAYRLRRRADGLAFRLGWDAARLIARTTLEDRLMDRAIAGQEDRIEWDEDRRTRMRRHHDNRLALSMLGRLDRFAESEHGLHRPAQRIAQDWEAFIALVARAADADEVVAFCTLDDARVEQCKPATVDLGGPDDPRADAREADAMYEGCDEDDEGYRIWHLPLDDTFATNFPPPPGFDGTETGRFGEGDYFRMCTQEEVAMELALQRRDLDRKRAQGEQQWRRWFGLAEPA